MKTATESRYTLYVHLPNGVVFESIPLWYARDREAMDAIRLEATRLVLLHHELGNEWLVSLTSPAVEVEAWLFKQGESEEIDFDKFHVPVGNLPYYEEVVVALREAKLIDFDGAIEDYVRSIKPNQNHYWHARMFVAKTIIKDSRLSRDEQAHWLLNAFELIQPRSLV